MASDPRSGPDTGFGAIAAACLPPRRTGSLAYRQRSALPMDPASVPPEATLLFDTTVYIDGIKRSGLPPAIEALTQSHPIQHAKPCLAELTFGYGRLDPAHPKTQANRLLIAEMLAAIPAIDVVDASPAGWAKAGALAGWLARTQGLTDDRRRALFNDALLFVTAQELGYTLLSGNIQDMDLLLQIGGPADVLLYALD